MVAITVSTIEISRLRVAVKKIAKKTRRRTHRYLKRRLATGMMSCIKYDVPTFNRIMITPEMYGLAEKYCANSPNMFGTYAWTETNAAATTNYYY